MGFSPSLGKKEVVLETGYPEKGHGVGKTRSLEEPFIKRIIEQTGPFGQFENEVIDPHYILNTDPQRSHLIPGDIRYFPKLKTSIRFLIFP